MSYQKSVWTDRIAEYPTRRTLTKEDGSTEIVTVARDEGNVVQEGSAFSAENMNGMEERISNAFKDVEESTLTFNNVVVPASNFTVAGGYADYPYRAQVVLEGVTVNHKPTVTFSMDDTLSGSFAPLCESYNGGVYIFAIEKPASNITISTIQCIK